MTFFFTGYVPYPASSLADRSWNTLCALNYRMDADNCQMKKAATVQTVAAFFSEITMPELHPDKCILRCVANRASPVIRKVFKLFALFRIIINVTANRASPHNNLLDV